MIKNFKFFSYTYLYVSNIKLSKEREREVNNPFNNKKNINFLLFFLNNKKKMP